MFDFFRKLFAPERSSETAKERLRLVLLSDHLSLAPETVEALKQDLLEVISRYVDIDAGAADVTFEQRDHEVAMLASIPITGVREQPRNVASATAEPTAQTPAVVTEAVTEEAANPVSETAATFDFDEHSASSELAPARTTDSESGKTVGDFASAPARSGNAARPRRRRRKKSAAAAAAATSAQPDASTNAPEHGTT